MSDVWKSVAASSIAGIVIIWLLWKLIPVLEGLRTEMRARMRKLEEAMDRLSKATLISTLDSTNSENTKKQASEVLRDVEISQNENKENKAQ